jgi:hypothetical protein
MRLIRLVSDLPKSGSTLKSEFENYFNDNIKVSKNSKIALQSLTLPVNKRVAVIDNASDELQFLTKQTDGAHDIHLQHGEYEIPDLLTYINKTCWTSLNFDKASDIGFKLLFTSPQSNLCRINMWRVALGDMSTDDVKTLNKNINIAGNKNLTSLEEEAGNTSFLYSVMPFINSCGILQTRVVVPGDMIFGLTLSTFDKETLDDDAVKYGVKVQNNAADEKVFYYKNINGDFIQTNIIGEEDDYVLIELRDGRIHYVIYDADGNESHELGDVAFDFESYNFAIGLRDVAASSSYLLPKITYDPEFMITTDGTGIMRNTDVQSIVSYIDEPNYNDIGATPKPPPNLGNSVFYLNFTKPALGQLLGFYAVSYNIQGVATVLNGDNKIGILSFPENLICELLSLPLDSYDGLINSKRNILAIMQNMNLVGTKLVYNVQNPLFLDLNLANDITLRSLRVKILKRADNNEAEELLDLDDRMEMTVLINTV